MKNIIFDLGGVLIDWNPRYLYRKIINDEKRMEHFLVKVCNHDWNELQDGGRLFAEAVRERVENFPEWRFEIESYHSRWPEMLGAGITEAVKILEDLHRQKNHQLFALTNWSAETFHFAQEKFNFLKHFERIIVSGEIKLKKPDPKIFLHLCETCKIKPEESLFIDDVQRNIDAAQNMGFKTIHFESPKKLKQELEFLGIKLC